MRKFSELFFSYLCVALFFHSKATVKNLQICLKIYLSSELNRQTLAQRISIGTVRIIAMKYNVASSPNFDWG